jgi:protein-arginine kinase activator protein McsA
VGDTAAPVPQRTTTSGKRLMRNLAEGKRFETYVEQQTQEMRVCFLCDKIFYRRKPVKRVGARWVCIDCLRALKESIDTLEQWEQLATLRDKIEKDVDRAWKPER